MALVTALHADPHLENIGDQALRTALSGTDHAALAFHLTLLSNLLASRVASLTEQVTSRSCSSTAPLWLPCSTCLGKVSRERR